MVVKENAVLAISFWFFGSTVYLTNPRSPQYIFYFYPTGEGLRVWALFAIEELYVKGVAISLSILIHVWFIVTVALETTSLTLLR